ncbi:MAG: T9SS type A sorting domain-containing protein [Ignavibacteriaceae bacterium]|nr:T9SS type A sorting domain-containing protein [Ignavibacteriaceae bacterium]
MKHLFIKYFFVLAVIAFNYKIMGTSISGNITYTGPDTNKIFVAAFTDPNLDSEAIPVQIDAPGAYTISGLADGVYYLVSVMTASTDNHFEMTDPWGVYGTWGKLTPVTLSGGIGVTGIDITLVDGTLENPNPFYRSYIEPEQTFQLPASTQDGIDPCISTDGTFIYLYKHDYPSAPSGKIYKINPSNAEVIFTYYLTQESIPNGVSWIHNMTFYKGEFWATGGYGDPSGTGYIEGVFKVDLAASRSSNQLPLGSSVVLNGGFASDGNFLYAGISTMDKHGIVKFDPALVSEVPSAPLIELSDSPEYLCYGNNYLWAATDSVSQIEPLTGTIIKKYNLPSSAAEVYLNDLFWSYDEEENTLSCYSIGVVGDANNENTFAADGFYLSQNYPNPFNPVTNITFTIPSASFVTLKIFDALGKVISTLIAEEKPAGIYSQKWYANGLTSGVYFYQLQAGSFTETRKLILLQ